MNGFTDLYYYLISQFILVNFLLEDFNYFNILYQEPYLLLIHHLFINFMFIIMFIVKCIIHHFHIIIN